MTAIISAYRFLYLQMASLVGYGWAIVALSFICSFLMLPLMRAVAGIVRREKEYEDVIQPQIDAIKANHASDVERHFHIQALYQRYGYSPLSPIKKVLPLFVQIPFLLLTYYMLKGTTQLSGVSFLFLCDLGQPDALLDKIGYLPVNLNVLPVVMTVVNVLTVFATPGFTRKDQTQAIAISILFLVLLYTAPSALLLYWTLNNVITLIRTLFADKCAGLKLLSSRLVFIFDPRNWFSLATPRILAWTALALIIVEVYFYVTARSLAVLTLNCLVTYTSCTTGMVCVPLVLIAITFILLWNDSSSAKVILILSATVMLLSFVVLLGIRFFSTELYYAFKVYADRYTIARYFMFFILPCYLIRHPAAYRGYARTLCELLKRDWQLLVLPIAFAIHYAYSSANIVPGIASLVNLAIYMTLPVVIVTLTLVFSFRKWIDSELIVRVVAGVFVGVYLIPMFATEHGILSYDRNVVIRLLVLISAAGAFALAKNRAFVRVFTIVILLFTSMRACLIFATSDEGSVKTRQQSKLVDILKDIPIVNSNNVYFLIYDSYAHFRLQKSLGINDPTVQKCLENAGFKLYDAYSQGWHTLSSMSRVFTFADIAGGSLRSTVAGDNVYGDYLRQQGYRTSYLLCSYTMPEKGDRLPGDFYYPTPSVMVPVEKVLFGCILRGILSQNPTVFNFYTHDEWVEQKREVVGKASSKLNFVYAHSSIPDHASMDARHHGSNQEEINSYAGRLKQADREIKEDALFIVGKDPNAIIIMASDHGPSLLMSEQDPNPRDVMHLLDHYGTFLAIRWPKNYRPVLHLNCLQNVMLEVLIYLTNDNSLVKYAVSGATLAFGAPLNVPDGYVDNARITVGPDKGKSLFDSP